MLLIVENDVGFARFLLDAAREQGMKGLVTSLGAAALALAREYKPDAITLDIFLPDIDGWRVLERLKNDLATRHLPVCVISTDEARRRALASGAIAFLAKPIQSRDVLDGMLRPSDEFHLPAASGTCWSSSPTGSSAERIRELWSRGRRGGDHGRPTVEAALAHACRSPARLRRGQSRRSPPSPTSWPSWPAATRRAAGPLPVIVYGPSATADGAWNRLADACTLRHVDSPDRLLDLTVLFTHRTVRQLAEDKRQMLDRPARFGPDPGRQEGADRR